MKNKKKMLEMIDNLMIDLRVLNSLITKNAAIGSVLPRIKKEYQNLLKEIEID